MPEYTQDWFTVAIPLFEEVLKDYKDRDGANFLEIGSFEGRSAVWMLENILTGNSKITCIDSFEGSNEFNAKRIKVDGLEERFKSNLSPFIGKYKLIKDTAEKALRTLPLESFDAIYIDGSHEASDTLEDACLSYRLLKVGGLMLFDDYMWNVNNLPSHRTPKIAVDGFIESFKGKMSPTVVTWKTLVLRKDK